MDSMAPSHPLVRGACTGREMAASKHLRSAALRNPRVAWGPIGLEGPRRKKTLHRPGVTRGRLWCVAGGHGWGRAGVVQLQRRVHDGPRAPGVPADDIKHLLIVRPKYEIMLSPDSHAPIHYREMSANICTHCVNLWSNLRPLAAEANKRISAPRFKDFHTFFYRVP